MKNYNNNSKKKIIHWPGKTIFESDNNLFSLITMNHHPVHLDINYAKRKKKKKILVNGLLVISIVVGMSVKDISLDAVANLGYDKIIHHNPVFLNDTLYAESLLIKKEKTKKKNYRICTYDTFAHNQNNKLILSLQRKILIKV